MNYRLSWHAEEQLERRQIPNEWLDMLLDGAEQRFRPSADTEILQSRFAADDGRMYLLRAVMAIDKEPPVVVTVYRTSKIEKYWRPE